MNGPVFPLEALGYLEADVRGVEARQLDVDGTHEVGEVPVLARKGSVLIRRGQMGWGE